MNAERVTAILDVLADMRSQSPGRIGFLVGFPRTKRLDTGVRTTLMAMERRGLVDHWRSDGQWGGDNWFITDEGRKFLEHRRGPDREV